MSPLKPPRGSTASRPLRKFKVGKQVVFGLFYPNELEFSKSEVICLRNDLREVIQLQGHLEGSKLVIRYILAYPINQSWNFEEKRSFVSIMTS